MVLSGLLVGFAVLLVRRRRRERQQQLLPMARIWSPASAVALMPVRLHARKIPPLIWAAKTSQHPLQQYLGVC
jgi:hypothetical protein